MSQLLPSVKGRTPSATRPADEPMPDEACGNCRFAHLVPKDLNVVECRGTPPIPVVVGMSPQGPAITLLRPNLPRKSEACGLWQRKKTIVLAR